MSLELAFKRMAIRPAGVCQTCRRAFATSRRTQQSATAGLADSLIIGQKQRAMETQRQPTQPATAPATLSAPPAGSTPTAPWKSMGENLVNIASASSRRSKRAQELADMERQFTRQDLEQQMTRRFAPGDVYAPHDLSGVEMAKWKKLRRKPKSKYDVLDQLNLNPLDHYKNFSIMSEYITPMGRIRHSNDTGLRPVNQRKMAKAIRRAMGMGLMPGVHRHPEIIKAEEKDRSRRSGGGY